MSLQSDGDLRIVLGVLIFLTAAMAIVLFWHFIKSRLRGRRPESGATIAGLQSIEKKNLLTKEELARVRQAMARQYLQDEKEREQAAAEERDMKPLEALAWEAQQAAIVAEKKAPASSAKPPAEPAPLLPPAPPAEEETGLPERLRVFADKPEEEIESLRNAGFMSEEDYELVMEERRRSGCRECGDS